jgi:hypothetical protein
MIKDNKTQTLFSKDKIKQQKLPYDPFWYKDITILYNFDRLTDFIPTKQMNFAEQLNAFVRFALYFSILLFILYKNYMVFYVFIITMLITLFIYEYWDMPVKNFEIQEEFENLQKQFSINKDQHLNTDGSVCTKPTKDNPFMNVLVTDIVDNPDKPPNCPLTPIVNEQIEDKFSYNLYKDIDDIWNKNNSQREFYTNPSTTIPNDRESFQKWLYETGPTCKEDSIMCNQRLALDHGVPNSGSIEQLKAFNEQISPTCLKDCKPNTNTYYQQ